MSKTTVIVSVTNDLVTDQRVHKVCTYLQNKSCSVTLVGRRKTDSLPIQRSYRCKRFRLLFNKGALFYAEFNMRLFFYLLFKKADLFLSNDLDTLLANKTALRFKSTTTLVYDTHEFFTEVPELVSRPKVQKIWERIEARIFPKLEHIYTVNQSIADLYKKKYGKELFVVRNISPLNFCEEEVSRDDLNLPNDKKIVILQGAGINVDRGAEELLQAMDHLDGYHLIVVGSGDVLPILKELAKERQDITFVGKKPYAEMMRYTAHADVGVSLDKDTNINYRYSLPNKIFDYIHAGTPVVASNLVEVKNIVEKYGVGAIVSSHDPAEIAEKIRYVVEDIAIDKIKSKLKIAAEELNWENESLVLDKIYLPLLA